LHAPNCLVNRPELCDRERRADERRRDACELEVEAYALDRIPHDPSVVEGQIDLSVERLRYRDQLGGRSVRARDD